ncbi:MAG: DUF5677 domain-containing protein [Bacteroidota bacterium]
MSENINKISVIAKPYIEKIFNEVFKIIENDLGALIKNHPEFNESFRYLSIFEVRISRIIHGILDLLLKDNLYSCKILLRPLIEHTLKLDYLIQKSLSDKNDNIFKEYALFCDLYEELQYQKSLDFKSKILTGEEIDEVAFQDLIKRRPEIKEYSRNKIIEKANQFTFRNIFKYLNENHEYDFINSSDEKMKKSYKTYLQIGSLYSDLSSFIHGGTFADGFELKIQLDKEINDFEIIDISEYVVIMNFYASIAFIGFCNTLENKYDENIKRVVDYQLEYYKKI